MIRSRRAVAYPAFSPSGTNGWRSWLFLGLLLCASWGRCDDIAVATTIVPDKGLYVSEQYTFEQLRVRTDVVYSTRPNPGGLQYTSDRTKPAELGNPTLALKLDIAVPPNATASRPQPLILWIHGGGFYGGGKEDMRAEALSYARAGYVAATVNYRLTANNMASPATRLIAITQASEDVMNAIRYLKANAALYHIDADRIATIGSSAGGGISLINAIEFDTLQHTVPDDAATSSRVAAAISTGATLVDATARTKSLLTYDAKDTPVMLFHASPTDSVTGATWTGNVLPTCDRINASGNHCTTAAQADKTHITNLALGGVWWPLLKPFLWEALRLGVLSEQGPAVAFKP